MSGYVKKHFNGHFNSSGNFNSSCNVKNNCNVNCGCVRKFKNSVKSGGACNVKSRSLFDKNNFVLSVHGATRRVQIAVPIEAAVEAAFEVAVDLPRHGALPNFLAVTRK